MIRVIIVIAVIVLVQFCAANARGQNSSRPNVLIIHADQHRFDCLGAMGNPDIKTPHLDRLASEGVLFRNSFCVWPVCTPSRYSLLTGQYVRQHRGQSNHCTLLPGTKTHANILREAGYKTKAVGKMHFTPAYLDVGFSEMELAEQHGPGRLVDDYHRYLRDLNLIDVDDSIDQLHQFRQKAPDKYWQTCGAYASNLPEEHHSTTWIGRHALATLDQWKSDQPNLLMVGFIKPHHPFDPPAPWDKMYDPDKLNVLPGWTDRPLERDYALSKGYFDNSKLTKPVMQQVMAQYYATISQIDHYAGQLIDKLKQKGLYDNTLIIYTSDHGEFMGFHHMLLKGNYMYDPLIKVPLIVKFPRGAHAGQVSEALVNSLNVTSTIIKSAGCKDGPDMRGQDLGPILTGEKPRPEYVFAEDWGATMVRSKDYKLIYRHVPDTSLFFDLRKDPHEMNNLYNDSACKAEVDKFKAVLLNWFQCSARNRLYLNYDAPQVSQPNVPPDREKAEQQMRQYIEKQMAKELPEK